MRRYLIWGASLLLLTTGAANAQTAPAESTPTAPSASPTTPATPNAITPPNGVARGVIHPNRPVDRGMVTQPPSQQRHTMPVIKPPGTAR